MSNVETNAKEISIFELAVLCEVAGLSVVCEDGKITTMIEEK